MSLTVLAVRSNSLPMCYHTAMTVKAAGWRIERLSLAECHRAGRAFADYHARGGERGTILADFLIGAQAAMRGWPLVTRDLRGFARYFPEITIIDPLEDQA